MIIIVHLPVAVSMRLRHLNRRRDKDRHNNRKEEDKSKNWKIKNLEEKDKRGSAQSLKGQNGQLKSEYVEKAERVSS